MRVVNIINDIINETGYGAKEAYHVPPSESILYITLYRIENNHSMMTLAVRGSKVKTVLSTCAFSADLADPASIEKIRQFVKECESNRQCSSCIHYDTKFGAWIHDTTG